jgi:hypothetical protein
MPIMTDGVAFDIRVVTKDDRFYAMAYQKDGGARYGVLHVRRHGRAMKVVRLEVMRGLEGRGIEAYLCWRGEKIARKKYGLPFDRDPAPADSSAA